MPADKKMLYRYLANHTLMTSELKQRPELVTSSVDDSAENSSTSSMDSSSFAGSFVRQVGRHHHHHHHDHDRFPFRQSR